MLSGPMYKVRVFRGRCDVTLSIIRSYDRLSVLAACHSIYSYCWPGASSVVHTPLKGNEGLALLSDGCLISISSQKKL